MYVQQSQRPQELNLRLLFKFCSLPWFIRTFEAKGIVFDEIYGGPYSPSPRLITIQLACS